ncbi:HU family DNA-binding protein [Raineya orbicola]|jgi:DNA-binding protein HU-beta|uniref:Bacterial nucleoid DNA-binding protein n=1 Tax=Raineya orbicola TaxID=2016530 RepID=A0A2N3IHH6_9BACT|nr:HU family DNA-binding protein [Raineya orbicola]PKQ69810.1 Bacterial nucleoid DNA-binding protein [Raineya orbicola]
MTKAEVVAEIVEKTGVERIVVQAVVEQFCNVVKTNMTKGENIYIRGFGSFINKKRAKKTARNISKNTAIIIDAHYVPAFKPAKTFAAEVKKNVTDKNVKQTKKRKKK